MNNSSEEKYFVWQIQGGLGKNIAATSLIPLIKKTYPDRKLIVICSYPQIFLNNPYIDRIYTLGNLPHFYEDYIENKDVIISVHEPYHQTGHIRKQQHVLKSWSELLDIEYNGELPQLYYNYAEQKAYQQESSLKPILLIHTSGGPLEDKVTYNWTRDIPMEFASAIVDKYSSTHNIIQITRKERNVIYFIHYVMEVIGIPLHNFHWLNIL